MGTYGEDWQEVVAEFTRLSVVLAEAAARDDSEAERQARADLDRQFKRLRLMLDVPPEDRGAWDGSALEPDGQ